MLIVDVLRAWGHVISRPLRRIFWKSLALTIGLLLIAWIGLARGAQWALDSLPWLQQYPAAEAGAVILAGAGLLIGIAFVIPPVSAVVAGFFLDDVAAVVEADAFPADPPGRPLPAGEALLAGLRFAGVALLVNLGALLFLHVPGVNLVIFLGANAYLLSREYFELAAARFRPMAEAAALRRRHRGRVLLAGLPIALMLAVPIVNLFTPLFGVALMVHVHKRLAAREAARDTAIAGPA